MSYNSITPLKILIVEDNLIDRKQLERLLSKSTPPPSEIKHAEYPENALALLNTDDFDTAIPDLNLPDSSGLDTAGKTERLRFKVGLPFIETGVSTIVAVLVVTRVLGAFVCRYDAASCTHKPDLRVTAAQTVLLQQHILPADTIIEQAIK
jgi:CheY-like chemotaxis protein